jgi:hypothetical protein
LTANANVSLTVIGVNQTAGAFNQVRNSLNGLNAGTNAVNSTMLRNRRIIQGAGMQLSDFSVQVAGGQSAILALTQQLPQFVQQFGATGGVLAALITILGTLWLVLYKTGTSLNSITPIAGVLQDQVGWLVTAFQALGQAAIYMANLVVNNLDRILITASVVAAWFAYPLVAAFVAARIAAFTLVGAFNALRAAMIKSLFGLILIAIGEVIYQIMRLVEATGSVGKAWELLKNVAVEAFERIGIAFGVVPLAIQAGAAEMKVIFLTALSDMMQAFQDFTWSVADGMNSLFGMGLSGAIMGPISGGMGQSDMDRAISGAMGDSAAAQAASAAQIASLTAPMTSVTALTDALGTLTDTQYDVRDWFGGVADAADGGGGGSGGGAAAAVKAVADAFKDLKESMGSSIETFFMDVTKGTKSVSDAFKVMASDIIEEMYRVMVVQQWVSQIMKTLSFFIGSPVGSTTDILGAVSGARAKGGPVKGGETYLVGEEGPELFTAPKSGQIVPNGAFSTGSGSGGTGTGGSAAPVVIEQHFHMSLGVSQTVQAEVMRMMPVFRRQAEAAIIDAKRRGGATGAQF